MLSDEKKLFTVKYRACRGQASYFTVNGDPDLGDKNEIIFLHWHFTDEKLTIGENALPINVFKLYAVMQHFFNR
jgi:hypothetical protein